MRTLLVVLGMSVLACAAHAGTVTQDGLQVVKIFAGYAGTAGGPIYFTVDQNPSNPAQCVTTKDSYRIFAAAPEYSNVDRILGLLMMAKATGGTVSVQVYDDKCLGTTAVIRRVAVY